MNTRELHRFAKDFWTAMASGKIVRFRNMPDDDYKITHQQFTDNWIKENVSDVNFRTALPINQLYECEVCKNFYEPDEAGVCPYCSTTNNSTTN